MKKFIAFLTTITLLSSLSLFAEKTDNCLPEMEAESVRPLAIFRIQGVGPYIGVGSYRNWVQHKLGKPEQKISSRLYTYAVQAPDFADPAINASWKAVIHFNEGGRVQEILLVAEEQGGYRVDGSILAMIP